MTAAVTADHRAAAAAGRGARRACRPLVSRNPGSYPHRLMRVTVLPQRKQVEIAGRRRAADVLRELGFLPGTAMVIRRDELLPESAMLEADDDVEVRSVISGGAA
jgi:sulfur carrier protein ThiS